MTVIPDAVANAFTQLVLDWKAMRICTMGTKVPATLRDKLDALVDVVEEAST